MSTSDGGVPVSLPLRERLFGVFKVGRWFRKSSRRSEKKRSNRTKTDNSGIYKKARSSNELTTTPTKSTIDRCSKKKVKEGVHPHQQQQTQQPERQQKKTQPHISSISNPPVVARAKIANYEPPVRNFTSRRVGTLSAASSRNYSGNLSAASRHNSGTQSVPVSGELLHGGVAGGPRMTRQSSKSLSKLRDQYVRAMLKLGDMGNSVSVGHSVNFESQVFESEVIRKRSQADNEMMQYYLNSSIQPNEWKDAHMGSRINRNGEISV